MTEDAAPPVFVFETTHHALWAEDVAREHTIPAEVVPAPVEAEAKCGLALQCMPSRVGDLEGALTADGVPYRVYRA